MLLYIIYVYIYIIIYLNLISIMRHHVIHIHSIRIYVRLSTWMLFPEFYPVSETFPDANVPQKPGAPAPTCSNQWVQWCSVSLLKSPHMLQMDVLLWFEVLKTQQLDPPRVPHNAPSDSRPQAALHVGRLNTWEVHWGFLTVRSGMILSHSYPTILP
jgi:hypothetical protein